jgi:hypothetical protein
LAKNESTPIQHGTQRRTKRNQNQRGEQENKIKGNRGIGCRHLNETISKIVNKEKNITHKILFSSMWKNE